MDFPTLVIICVIIIVVLKLIGAATKVILSGVALAAVVWFVLYILPDLSISLPSLF